MIADGNGGGELDREAVAELRRLARSRPRSGREAIAKASALRTLERFNRAKRQVPPMPEGWYPHQPGDPFYELDWVFLHEHPEILQRHWELAWREGRVECPGCYSRSPAASRASGSVEQFRSEPHFPSRHITDARTNRRAPPSTGTVICGA